MKPKPTFPIGPAMPAPKKKAVPKVWMRVPEKTGAAKKATVKKAAVKQAAMPSPSPAVNAASRKPRLYTLSVALASGPFTQEFDQANPICSRTILIRGDQTLKQLHDAIFKAFDREDAHMYEFQFGEAPMDPKGPRYVLSLAMGSPGDDGDDPIAGTVERTTLDMLDLKKDRLFDYWFDFGDDWWHTIEVNDIADEIPAGKYPKITDRIGASPPQYAEFDEEEDEEDVEDADEESSDEEE